MHCNRTHVMFLFVFIVAPAAPAAAARRTPTSSSSSASKRAVVSPAPAAVVPASPAPSPLAATQLLPVEAKDNSDLQSPQRMKQKLEGLAGRFDGFEDELNLSRHKKKADEDKRILILQTQLTNLQSSLALESKNRSMSVKALQNVREQQQQTHARRRGQKGSTKAAVSSRVCC